MVAQRDARPLFSLSTFVVCQQQSSPCPRRTAFEAVASLARPSPCTCPLMQFFRLVRLDLMQLTFALSLPHVGKHRESSGATNLGGSAWGNRGAMSTNRDARRSLLMCLETTMQPVSVAIEVRLCFLAPELVEVLGLTDARGVNGDQRVAQNVLKKSERRIPSTSLLWTGRLVLSERIDAKNGITTRWKSTIKYPRMACKYPWAESESKIEVFGDANVAGCISTRKSTVGGLALWSGQFCEGVIQNFGHSGHEK